MNTLSYNLNSFFKLIQENFKPKIKWIVLVNNFLIIIILFRWIKIKKESFIVNKQNIKLFQKAIIKSSKSSRGMEK